MMKPVVIKTHIQMDVFPDIFKGLTMIYYVAAIGNVNSRICLFRNPSEYFQWWLIN